jgi:hypothetical protein
MEVEHSQWAVSGTFAVLNFIFCGFAVLRLVTSPKFILPYRTFTTLTTALPSLACTLSQ